MISPLPVLTEDQVSLSGALSRHRVLPPILGRAAEIGPPNAQIRQPTLLGVTFHAGAACLAVPSPLLTQILAGIDPAAPHAPPPWAALLLEHAIAPALEALEAAAPSLALTVSPDPPPENLPYALGITLDGTPLRLDLSEPAARAVAAALQHLPIRRRRLPDLPVRLAARLAWCSVPARDLRAASLGDVILPETIEPGHVFLMAGETFRWPARQEGNRLTVAGTRQGPAAAQEWWMQDDALPGPQDTGLDDLPIRLSFELGQLDLTLAELEAIAPGHVFELSRPEADGVDIIANGKRIGAGRAVTINGTLGVQIVRLAGR